MSMQFGIALGKRVAVTVMAAAVATTATLAYAPVRSAAAEDASAVAEAPSAKAYQLKLTRDGSYLENGVTRTYEPVDQQTIIKWIDWFMTNSSMGTPFEGTTNTLFTDGRALTTEEASDALGKWLDSGARSLTIRNTNVPEPFVTTNDPTDESKPPVNTGNLEDCFNTPGLVSFSMMSNDGVTIYGNLMTIEPKEVTVTWTGTDGRKEGDGKVVHAALATGQAYPADAQDVEVEVSGGTEGAAGTHTATAQLVGKRANRYKIANPTIEYTLAADPNKRPTTQDESDKTPDTPDTSDAPQTEGVADTNAAPKGDATTESSAQTTDSGDGASNPKKALPQTGDASPVPAIAAGGAGIAAVTFGALWKRRA